MGHMFPSVCQSHKVKKRVRDMKTSSTRHVTMCFETCIAVRQKHPMGSDTCLQRSPGSAHGLHQSKTQPTLPRLLAGGKQIHQRDSVLESSQVSFDQSYELTFSGVFRCCVLTLFRQMTWINPESVQKVFFFYSPRGDLPSLVWYACSKLTARATHDNKWA